MSSYECLFFDLGDTLVTPEVDTSSGDLVALQPLDFAIALLERLKAGHYRLGIISNTGRFKGPVIDALLAKAGLLKFFEEDGLLIYSADVGMTKDKPEIFRLAIDRTGGGPAEKCIYIGEDENERDIARSVGMRVCAHPLDLDDMLLS